MSSSKTVESATPHSSFNNPNPDDVTMVDGEVDDTTPLSSLPLSLALLGEPIGYDLVVRVELATMELVVWTCNLVFTSLPLVRHPQ